ncbi:MAG: cation-translocating P-type ATPase [Planctomycetota bacterium]|jgi:Ca2+-transporting ATPase
MREPYSRPITELIEELGVDPRAGLDENEVQQRRLRYGPNRLRPHAIRSAWQILLDQFRSLILVLLAAAMVLSLLGRDWPEAIAIAVVIAINTAIGFIAEIRAERSMEALRQLGTVTTIVRRSGQPKRVEARSLVPGDIVLAEGGDVVAADLRLVRSSMLEADESALTGESVPVEKEEATLPASTILAERRNMLHRGTALTRGSAVGLVVATGMATELGRISQLMEAAPEDQRTPLERRLDDLGRRLVWVTLAITALVAIVGMVGGKDAMLVVKTAVALAVAAVPEGLPVVATLALARGMWRMAQRNAIVNRLAAVETLGSTNVICTDKTGTLTENRLTVRRIVTGDGSYEISGEPLSSTGDLTRDGAATTIDRDPVLREFLEAGALCNNATWPVEGDDDTSTAMGEPLEVALLVAAAKAGIDAATLAAEVPRDREIAFDPEVRLMASIHARPDGYRAVVKGAPESVLDRCVAVIHAGGPVELDDAGRDRWRARNDELAAAGLRVLALATKIMDAPDTPPYDHLSLLGLVGMVDPARADVAASVAACHRAGIRVVMVTGDHAATARYVAERVGILSDGGDDTEGGRQPDEPGSATTDEEHRLLETSILARVTPAQKLQLVRLHRRCGNVVAMTGDGVNDAPALRQADIGIAMGRRGTEVARQAADIVLRDDAFSTIVLAVEQGRVIFENIRTFVRYLISCNLSEILVVLVAALVNAPLPILPMQILFLNLVTDVFPALALGLGEGDPQILERSPRPSSEPILTRRLWLGLVGYGVLITVAVLAAFAVALRWLEMSEREAVTVSFLTLAFAQLWHVFNRNEVTTNPYVWGALLICCILLLAFVHVPVLSDVLQIADPGLRGWSLALGLSLVPVAIGQVVLTALPRTTVE